MGKINCLEYKEKNCRMWKIVLIIHFGHEKNIVNFKSQPHFQAINWREKERQPRCGVLNSTYIIRTNFLGHSFWNSISNTKTVRTQLNPDIYWTSESREGGNRLYPGKGKREKLLMVAFYQFQAHIFYIYQRGYTLRYDRP